MVSQALAARFWAAVEDCLVTFHRLERPAAAEQVTTLWRRLAETLSEEPPAMADMIYHAEPWSIACNLAQQDLALEAYESEYAEILRRHSLNPSGSEFTVILTAAGQNRLKVVKAVRDLTASGIEEAKRLVESTPKPIKFGANQEEAEAIRRKFSDAGASVEVRSTLSKETL